MLAERIKFALWVIFFVVVQLGLLACVLSLVPSFVTLLVYWAMGPDAPLLNVFVIVVLLQALLFVLNEPYDQPNN